MLSVPIYQTRSYISLTDAVIVVQNLTTNKNVQQSENIEDGKIVMSDTTSGHINFRAAVYASQAAFEEGAEPVEYFREKTGVDYFNRPVDEAKQSRAQAYDYLLSLDLLNESAITEGVNY